MAYQTFRVEITRDETRDDGPVGIEITAYIEPHARDQRGHGWAVEPDVVAGCGTVGCNTPAISRHWRRRLPRSWLPFPRPTASAANEYSVDNEFPVEVAPLLRSGVKWVPGT